MPTFEELGELRIEQAFEDRNSWYILPEPEGFYDNGMWVVNKSTKEVTYLDYPMFLVDYEEDCTPLADPSVIWS